MDVLLYAMNILCMRLSNVLAEMVAKGKHLAHFEDPSACGRTAYVTDGDIPQEIVDALNRKAKDYDEITPRDVSTFLNDALKRYYSTSMWPVNEETNGETVDEGENSVGMESMPDSDKHFSLVKLEDEKPTSSISRVDEFPPDHESISTSNNKPSLQETDPADLDRYYLVKGKMLMQLFRLCPRCGHRLNGAQLCAAGTAAVVKFLCDDCSIQQPVVRRWDSQDRKEQIFNCGT
ncbi:hypothetical protein OSTOST_05939 [Ostertagia ostertagi]